MTDTRWCPHCMAEKPLSEFYVNRAAASGIDGYCKEYRKERQRERARVTRANARVLREAAGEALQPRWRTDLRIDDHGRQCAKCNTYRSWADFYADKNAKTGHMSECVGCTAERQRIRRELPEVREAARRRQAEFLARKRGPDWAPQRVTRHSQLDCDGAAHRCTGCEILKSLDQFPRNPETPCGFDPRCNQCRHERRVERRTANHNDIRVRELNAALKRFGLVGEDYLWLLERQGGGCALCSQPESQGDKYFAGKKRLAVDHDHNHCGPGRACKECIRGLLCHNCNVGLGMFEGKEATRGIFANYLSQRPFVA